MPSVRIGLATPPFPHSAEHAMEHVETFVARAAREGARLVCFPESYVPGMRGIDEPVPPHSKEALVAALERAQIIAREHRVALILPMDWDDPAGILNLAMVIDENGELLGRQTKNQLDPTEDQIFIAGNTRRLFRTAGLTFGVTICHDGFRYPESVRWAARQGASIVFHPHCTGSNKKGRRPTEWQGRGNAYYEHAIMCRAIENEIYFASVNYCFAFQESATSLIAPNGDLISHQPYGEAGVLIADIDPERGNGRLAHRFNPNAYA